jgi:hypothetical protein
MNTRHVLGIFLQGYLELPPVVLNGGLALTNYTMMLRMLRKLCEQQGIEPETMSDDVESRLKKPDLHKLMHELRQKLPES